VLKVDEYFLPCKGSLKQETWFRYLCFKNRYFHNPLR
jgi:hypothetical protein